MPRERKHKNCESDDDSSSWSSDESHSDCDDGLFKRTPTIVCPPGDFHKRYDSSSSESSCPDFADLCKEKPRRRCRKESSKSDSSSEESWDSEDESSKSTASSCGGCDKRCTKCVSCKACKCRECSDYSLSSILSSLGATDTSCPDFSDLVSGKKHKKGKKSHCEQRCNKCDSCTGCGCRACKDVSISSVLSSLSSDSKPCGDLKTLAEPRKESHKKPHGEKVKPRRPEPRSIKVPTLVVMRSTARAPMRATDMSKEVAEILKETAKETAAVVEAVDTKSKSDKPLEILAEMKKESTSSSTRGKKFSVSFVSSEGHKWEHYNTSANAISINGSLGPTIHLYTGKSYVFSVAPSDGHALILTDKPDGGEGSRIIPGGFEPAADGNVRFQVTPNTPRYFFYHCAKHGYEGGQAIVHSE